MTTQQPNPPSPQPYIHPPLTTRWRASITSFRNDFLDKDGGKWERSPWRHSLGIVLLLFTVVLWTTSNFLASTMFADNTYSKPYFVTYVNSSFFCIPLIPIALHAFYRNPSELRKLKSLLPERITEYSKVHTAEVHEEEESISKPWPDERHGLLHADGSSSPTNFHDDPMGSSQVFSLPSGDSEKLGLAETAKLSVEFSFLWFAANYFVSACLEYTTVSSATILTSTSSIWTLLIGTLWGVEHFTIKKFLGVLVSVAGIVLISTVDMSGETDKNRGSFPHKTMEEIAIGDAMAFISAVLYGLYAVVMKKRIGDESRVNMPVFFGLVGLFNVLFMWPGFFILHLTGIEQFQLPPGGKVLTIILTNSTSSILSDFAWAYAMLLTSPLIVTVGLSLTIPLSLIVQIVLHGQYASLIYWFGAALIVASFLFVNHEEVKDEEMMASGLLGESGFGGSFEAR
ncbi:hypothetical protein EG328_006611 [Venturia inaequalis]|uniref:EamA domain-containing protein n=3 Tax=Venturia inaequalis TaxID=5025 RepID=A0A8H3UHU7_VENIN|nr:hypothetical protein EG328_006611 [Venturia inaequalis]